MSNIKERKVVQGQFFEKICTQVRKFTMPDSENNIKSNKNKNL